MDIVEDLRGSIFDKTEELFEYTGSCSLKKPNLENSFIGMLWKVASDTKVSLILVIKGYIEITNIECFTDDKGEIIEPYFKIQSDNLTNEGKAACNKLLEFIGSLDQKNEKMKEIESDMEILQEKSKFEHITGDSLLTNRQTNNTEGKEKKQTIEQ